MVLDLVRSRQVRSRYRQQQFCGDDEKNRDEISSERAAAVNQELARLKDVYLTGILFSTDGVEAARFVGYQGVAEMKAFLSQHQKSH